MDYLYDSLKTYCGEDYYPFHMPGHKRRMAGLADPFSFDITEIEGFDNLHHAEGILLEAQERANRLYGAKQTWFLVNGSTAGILSAIGTCVPEGEILMARNSHKAAYHGVYLNRLKAVYLYPKRRGEINGPITARDVEQALEAHPQVRAVYLTSPTYDGVVSEVEAIAKLAHNRGIPLIVDEAHGAHFGMHPFFPESAVRQGADIVIHSIHKTLPSLTQTALLHVNGELADRRRLKKLLGIYQTSSPSYVLMASMDQCVRLMQEQGKELMEAFAGRLKRFRESVRDLRILEIIDTDDPSKILISVKNAMTDPGSEGWNGHRLCCVLREKYHLELEMEAGSYGLALTSVADEEEGFYRLAEALHEIDAEMEKELVNTIERPGNMDKQNRQWMENEGDPKQAQEEFRQKYQMFTENQNCMTIAQAEMAQQEKFRLQDCAGRISGEYVYLYPPGIPLVVPGERISADMLELWEAYRRNGYALQGPEDYSMEKLWVVCE